MTIPAYPDPLPLFEEWLEEAKNCEAITEPFATTLATASAEGAPSARVVLLRDFGPEGFVFYTNLESAKAKDLGVNPAASLCFHWMPLDKQVRVRGRAALVDEATADQYFATRDRESQIGAWASIQSTTMPEPGALLERVQKYAQRFGDNPVPRPPFWSGYRIVPEAIEFWLRGPHRLHYRRRYQRQADGAWTSEMLYP